VTAPGYDIRLVRPDEHTEAGRVTAEAYTASYGELSEEYTASLLDVPGRVEQGDVFVAVEHGTGTILGTVWVARPGVPLAHSVEAGETDFRQLAVASSARRRGVGEALVRKVIDLARERGARRVVMNSGPDMIGAHALYFKLGFHRLGEREQRIEVEPGRWVDLLVFGIDLN
jgi:ribosomal protein S18 acetylase RimI-like enzyme